jgi:2-methylisocitrate lyase-like PEP mutase family enzyme
MTTADRRTFLQTAGMTAAGLTTLNAQNIAPAAAAQSPATAPRGMGPRFRQLLGRGTPFENICAYDVPSARLVEIVGFPSLFLGSSKAGEAHGLPDWGLLSLHEEVEFFGHIAKNVGIPVVADIDVNSEALVFYRAVKQFAQADVAALHFGDQIAAGGRQVGMRSVPTMVDLIHAARDASPDIVVSVRCQGLEPETIDRTLERAARYVEAGAETIWVFPELPRDMLSKAAATLKVPLTSQFGFNIPPQRAREWNVTVVFHDQLPIIHAAWYEALLEFKSTGMWVKSTRGGTVNQVMPGEIRDRMRGTPEFAAGAAKYRAGLR